MRLKITEQQSNDLKHKDVCTAVGWSSNNELYSCGDDKTVWRWNLNGEPLAKVCDSDSFITDIHWLPVPTKKAANTQNDVFVLGGADGSFSLISKSGRIDKIVKDAHLGAVVCVRWNHEGTALVTGGEDGVLKIWSRNGQLRSTLATTGKCIYSATWGPPTVIEQNILFTSGKDLIIKPLHATSSAKQMQWKAHDGIVLKVDWNILSKFIVSCGEDGKYKVWDSHGRNLYSSAPFDYSITSVSWSPDGETFAVGSFNTLKICDKTGWAYTRKSTNTGSILNISWTSDGTQLAAAGGNGEVCFAQLVERQLEWRNLVVSINENLKMKVHDILGDTSEEIEFRDKIIKWKLGFGHLVVATASQCWIYDVQSWNSPHQFDVKDNVSLILLSKKIFLMMDNSSGIQVYNYDGKLLSNPKFPGLRTEFLNSNSVSVSNDMICIIDKGEAEGKAVRLFNLTSSKESAEVIVHNMDIMEVALSQFGPLSERKLAFIDRNRDMYICRVGTGSKRPDTFKLATMVDSAKWNDHTDMLVAVCDGHFTAWYYPGIVYVDRDLLPYTRTTHDESEVGKRSQIIDFFGTRCNVRRWDGSVVTMSVSPHPLILYELVDKKNWEACLRLCRFVKDRSMWSCLVGMAIKNKEIETAETALAALEEVDKVQYMLKVKSIPSVEGRNAAMALYMRNIDEAESILLQAGLMYRAIKMHIKLYNWTRALELAVKNKNSTYSHIDTVVWYRRKYLEGINRQENDPVFLQYESLSVDWVVMKEKIRNEKEKEKQKNKR
ncbi:intraflagellar transport protein 80 [Acrasis kona]|uniref:Intraflagellar transport protein 80 n=1 Tax=Acrasis kona TaxID=1008807 RepID=A0AAW2YY09_9EUKA